MQKRISLVLLTLIAISVTLLLTECHVGKLTPILMGKKIWLNDDENLMKNEIRKIIPEGSSITEAQNILQLNGYQCGYFKESDAVDTIESNRTSKDADYLFCYLQISRLVCAQTYKPSIYYKDERVTQVDIKLGGWCL